MDVKFFGHNEAGGHYERIQLLTQQEIELLDLFVSIKMDAIKERAIWRGYRHNALAQFARVVLVGLVPTVPTYMYVRG